VSYVERDLRDSENGGFYSAEDADSYPNSESKEKMEGAFCVWENSEIEEALKEDAALFSYAYGVNPGGNVMPAYDPQGELQNKV
jgi:uncharacterized protein YyaL (SSP411 family)